MDRLIAYCGLTCSDCPAFRATAAEDENSLEELAAAWSREFEAEITPDDCRCVGCLGEEGPQVAYVATCEVRTCAVPRGVRNCAYCGDYPCEVLRRRFDKAPSSRKTLYGMRSEPAP